MNAIFWDVTIAFYLFSAGVSAGALIASIIADLVGKGRYGHIVKIGAWIAPIPVTLGTFALIFDLERPLYFWRLMVSFEPTSVMSIGAWILLLFTFVSIAYVYPHLPEKFDILKINEKVSRISSTAAFKITGLILAMATALYTGVLLNLLVARPLWNTPILPLIFLFSAVIDGIAAILILMYVMRHPSLSRDEFVSSKKFLEKSDLLFLVPLIISMAIMLTGMYFSGGHARNALAIITGGSFTIIFWIGVVVIGMLLPLAYDLYEMLGKHEPEAQGKSRLLALAVAASVLTGGFMLRYVVVYAGQLTGTVIN
jgi:formate-dependent nitrite reductase membrane component NrfD